MFMCFEFMPLYIFHVLNIVKYDVLSKKNLCFLESQETVKKHIPAD